jgi:hypothetical protein
MSLHQHIRYDVSEHRPHMVAADLPTVRPLSRLASAMPELYYVPTSTKSGRTYRTDRDFTLFAPSRMYDSQREGG